MKRQRSTSSASARRSLPAILAAALFVAGLAGTGLIAVQVRQSIRDDTTHQIEFAASQVSAEVNERLESYELVLRAGVGLFATTDAVTRSDWNAFVRTSNSNSLVSGIQAIGYAVAIDPGQLDAHEASVRAEGFPSYEVHPTGARPLYTPVVYVEPFDGANLRAFGYDMYSEPVRRAAMEAARDSGQPTMSAKVRLVQNSTGDNRPGAIVYAPVYRNGSPTTTVDERRSALIGWVFGAFNISDSMESIVAGWQGAEGRYLDLHAFEGVSTAESALLFDSDLKDELSVSDSFFARRTVNFRGQVWTLAFDRLKTAPPIDLTAMWAAISAGIILSGLMSGLVLSLGSTRSRARKMAADLTGSIRRRDRELEASEFRWKFAVEGHGDGMWDWDIPSESVFYSHQWKAMLGYADEEISDRVDEWSSRVHPDDAPRMMAALQAHIDGATPIYSDEHRVRCKDGSYTWILDSGLVVARDDRGRALRAIGTHKDVTEQRHAVDRIRELSELYRALSECNSAIVQSNEEFELYVRVCEVVAESDSIVMAWIGRTDSPDGLIHPIASAGIGTDYLDGIEVSMNADDPGGTGPTGTAARTGAPVWIADFHNDPRTRQWQERAEPFGWAGTAALPLFRDGRVHAVLTFYSCNTDWYDVEIQSLLDQMGSDISRALDKFAVEDTLKESEQRYRTVVEQSLAGVYIIDGFTLVYANPRMKEMFGYDESDDLVGMDVRELINDNDIADVAERQRKLMTGEAPRLDATFTGIRKDGAPVELGTTSARVSLHGRDVLFGMAQDLADRKVAEARIERYAQQLERTFIQTVALVTTLGELRDPYTAGHEGRVSELAVAIGVELGLGANRLEGIRVGAYLHDIGKMSIPSELLVKPTRLTPLETALIREHARAGHKVLERVDFPWPVATVALQHHERMDGSGYPDGLRGDEIILEARIVAVADVVESMASHRPYRPALGLDLGLAEIEQGAGVLYDHDVTEACLRLFREKSFRFST